MSIAKKTTIEISTLTLFKILAFVVALAFLYFIRDIILLAFIALVLASAIDPWVDWLQKWKVPRSLGTILIYTAALGAIFFSLWLLINPISTEVKNLSDDFPVYWQKLSSGWRAVESFSVSHGLQQQVVDALQSAQSAITALATDVFGGALSLVGGFFSVLIVLVIGFYLTVYDQQMKSKIRSYLPKKYQAYSTHLIGRMQSKIGLWLRGQLVLSLVIFFLVLVGLSLLGVKYVWVLALLAGVTEFIPYFGPILGAIPAIFIAFTQSPTLALMTLVLFLIIQQAENYLIVPQVMRKAVGLNPVIVIVAMMVGAQVAGIAGIIISIPVATALSLALDDILSHRKSGFSTAGKDVED